METPLTSSTRISHRGSGLTAFDAPEKGMPYWQKTNQFVVDRAAQKTVTVEVADTDRYGRSIGDVTLPDGRSLIREIVKAGYAWLV